MASAVLDSTWNISQKGEEIITENNKITNKSSILKNALNSDFKEIGSPVLLKFTDKSNISQVVLQIQKIRNISAPKSNEKSQAAPRMLKLILTDGNTYIQAIEIAPISFLSYENTPPGSKLLVQSAKIVSGYMLLDSNNCILLGGKVPSLYEKWELAKSVKYHNRHTSSSDGAPAWVNFGRKIQADVQESKLTSLDKKEQALKENSKFELQRQDAIAEVTSGAVKKVFGGSTISKVPQEQIISKNKRVNESAINRERKSYKTKGWESNEVEATQKPPERVSLFDFLEDKLPPPSEPPQTYNSSFQANNRKPQQNSALSTANIKPYQNSSFQANNSKSFQNADSGKPHHNSYPHVNNNRQNSNFYSNNTRPTQQQGSVNYHQQNPRQYNGNNSYRQKNDNRNVDNKLKEDTDANALSNSLGKMSINAQFASRSLKQHLNLEPQKKKVLVEKPISVDWKVGDECLAKYWEDGKFYNASITGVTEKTCAVKFKGYGNIEEVLKTDCLPAKSSETNKKYSSGSPDFRKSRTFSSRRPQ